MARRIMVGWLLIGLVLLYLGGCGYLFFGQRRIIFEPQAQPLHPVPSDFALPYETITIPVTSTQQLTGWWLPQNKGDKTLLFLHGNGGLTAYNFQAIALWYQAGYSVLAFNYRGYGQSSPGFPQESQVYEDAAAAYTFLTQTKGIPAQQLTIHGHSLGGAIAIELAQRYPVGGLFLEGTFTSMLAMSTTKPLYRIFPVSFLLHQRFNSAAKITQLQLPIFFCHGELDETVPSTMGAQLWAIANEPKQFQAVPGADHHNLAAVSPATIQQGIIWLEAHRALCHG
ncbi:alpha/beta hydrolase [Picosynechococcus sp. PCC 11901]|nr:alpha/beta hydrolase [Picosynechococcus sp. PCC 11901]